MAETQCRLCSSTHSLISLFSGKRRQTRDYIRKLILIILGIEVKKHDIFSYICLGCGIQLYNVYIFQIRSFENEIRLQEIAQLLKPRSDKNKVTIVDLDDIELPELDILKEDLAPWLQQKLNYCQNQDAEMETSGYEEYVDETSQATLIDNDFENISKKQVESPATSSNNNGILHKYTQKSIQCDILKVTLEHSERSIQCDILKGTLEHSEKSIQCDLKSLVKYKKQRTQCEILKSPVRQSQKIVQCNILKHGVLLEDKKIQCKIDSNYIGKKSVETQTNVNIKFCNYNNSTSILNFKREKMSPMLSPTVSVSLSPDPFLKSEIYPTTPSSKSSNDNLLIKTKVEFVKLCKICEKVLHSRGEVLKHRKIHMCCPLCNKTFKSMRDTLYHKQKCEILFSKKKLVVNAIRQSFLTFRQICFENTENSEMSSD